MIRHHKKDFKEAVNTLNANLHARLAAFEEDLPSFFDAEQVQAAKTTWMKKEFFKSVEASFNSDLATEQTMMNEAQVVVSENSTGEGNS